MPNEFSNAKNVRSRGNNKSKTSVSFWKSLGKRVYDLSASPIELLDPNLYPYLFQLCPPDMAVWALGVP